MPLNSGNPLNYYNSVSSFDTHPDYRHDFFNEIQRVVRGVSDINSGKADDFLDRAHTQNYWNTEEKLAEMQEKFIEDDPINNTPGRGNKNYRRMEYDIEKNPNGKGAYEDREEANNKPTWTPSELIKLMNNHKFYMCTTASAFGNAPITQQDYQDQIKLR